MENQQQLSRSHGMVQPRQSGHSGVRPGILLVDDYTLVREALVAFLEKSEFAILASASNGDEAVRAAEELQPAVAIIEVSQPLLLGLQSARAIRRCSPRTQQILLVDEETIRLSPPDMSGYVNKSVAADLVQALRHLNKSEPYFSEGLSAASFVPAQASADPRARLTDRECNVLRLIAAGKSSKQISTSLQMAHNTARTHRANLMRKLAVHSVASLVRLAVLWEGNPGLLAP